jgi:dephospho-CoA kinase
MLVLGLTGSIGMGKSTTAKFFADEGVPVLDADATVHALYEKDAAPLIEKEFPGTTHAGKVDRKKLSEAVIGNAGALKKLEQIVHPLYRRAERDFLANAEAAGKPIVVLDVPLLLETGGGERVDAVVVATAPAEMQKARLLEREGMTPEKFLVLLGKQMPDAEKRAKADFLVDTSKGFDYARDQVRAILRSAATLPKRRKD